MRDVTDLRSEFIGRTFRFITATDVVLVGKWAARVKCQCICGSTVLVLPHKIRSGAQVSCGCWKKAVLGESARTHGQANSRVRGYVSRAYGVWQAMRDRCSNSNRKDYHCYGGRGISVCVRWQRYENFLSDMGPPPAGATLDRINNDGDYAPDNCRWATRLVQAHNSRCVVVLEFGGEAMCVRAWARRVGIDTSTYYRRLRKGWLPFEALGLVLRKQ
jgi:hypothetical protein